MAEHEHKHHFIYSTHKEPLEAPKEQIKVSELKAIIGKSVEGFNAEYTLVLEEHGDRADKALNDNDEVRIHQTPHFYSQPPANFGR
jgi:molybdopterin converting factor small subunit